MPEGRDDKGWRSFASELHSVVPFLQSLYSGGSTGVCNGDRSSPSMGKSQSVSMLKPPMEVGGNRSFAEVSRKIPTLSLSMKGLSRNFDAFTPKGQILIGLSMFGDDKDP